MPFKIKFFRSELNGLKRWQGHGILLEKECIWGKCAIFLKTNCHPFFRPLNFKLKMIGALLHSLCFLLLINRDLGAPQFDTRSKCFSSLCRRGLFDKNFFIFQLFIFHWNLSQPAYFTFSLLASEVGSARGFSSSFDPNNFSILAFDPRSMIQQLESFIFWCSLLFFIPRWFGSQLWVPSSYI